jgi:ribonuclease Z
MKIDRIFITHWHADHWAGLIGLMQTMNLENRKEPLHIYGPEAERFVGDILDMDYWGPRFNVMAHDVPYEGGGPAEIFSTGDYTISSIPVEHSIPAVAYAFQETGRWRVDIKKAERLFGLKEGPMVGKLKANGEITIGGKKITLKDVGYIQKGIKVAYTGDTQPCKNILKIAEGADVLIHDATFTEEKEDRMHSGGKEAAQAAKDAGVEQLVLTHLSRRYQDPKPILDEAKKIFLNSIVAHDFMRMELKHPQANDRNRKVKQAESARKNKNVRNGRVKQAGPDWKMKTGD